MTIKEKSLAGLPLDIPVIDAHTHTGPKYRRGWHQNPDYTGVAAQLKLYDLLGIDCCVTIPHPLCDAMSVLTNETAAREAELFPGRVYGYIYIAPSNGMDICRENLEKYSKNPAFVGVKFLSGYQGQCDDPVYQYAADFANEAGCPLLMHTWADNPSTASMAKLAQEHPNLNLIIAHQGGGKEPDTVRTASYIKEIPNLYIDLCGSQHNTLSFSDIADLVGADRMIFGTDAVDLDPRFDFGRLALCDLDDEDKKQIFAGNYLRLLQNSQLGKIKL